MTQPKITFCPLSEVAPVEILHHMRDPKIATHLPLLTRRWQLSDVVEFVAVKEQDRVAHGIGHRAILCEGRYAGWGGLQKEGDDWDLGVVLRAEYFGLGLRVVRLLLEEAQKDPRIDAVTFLLPPSRRHLGALKRLGAQPLGDVHHEGMRFLKFKLPIRGAEI